MSGIVIILSGSSRHFQYSAGVLNGKGKSTVDIQNSIGGPSHPNSQLLSEWLCRKDGQTTNTSTDGVNITEGAKQTLATRAKVAITYQPSPNLWRNFVYSCPICSSTSIELTKHHIIDHKSSIWETAYQCQVSECQYTSDRPFNTARHIKESGTYPFFYPGSIQNHVDLSCAHCNEQWVYPRKRTRHEKNVQV